MIGTRLDKYEVLEKLGEGGMATVYLGRHSTLGREVAIKVLHPHLSSSQRNRKRFAREARAIEHLRHDNILEIFDYSGVEAADCYIITEFVPGRTLSEFREVQGSLPSEIVSIIGIALSEALSYAHFSGILHRDLKPENVMIRRDGEVKLMDFGIARFLNESQVTMTGALVGSPAYMSPEQATERDLDQRSDLFSLGTLLFEVATGHRPFTGSNPSLILKKIIDGSRPGVAELAPTISATLADTIERLLSTDPEDRFSTAGEVAERLRESCADIDLDPQSAAWCLGAFLDDPDGYNRRLASHVHERLLVNGKAALDASEHLKALRLFNRLLSLDENNEEVLVLIQGLHAPTKNQTGNKTKWILFSVITFLMILGGLVYRMTLPGPAAVIVEGEKIEEAQQVPTIVTKPNLKPVIVPTPTQAPLVAPETVAAEAIPVPTAPKERWIPPTALRPGLVPSIQPRPAPISPGMLRIAANYPADIYIGDEHVGNTRDREPMALKPGSHRLRIVSDLIKEQTVSFELAPGEQKEVTVNLQARHTYLNFDKAFDPRCSATVNGIQAGTLTELSYQYRVERPDLPHTVKLECGEESHDRNWEFMVGTATFTRP